MNADEQVLAADLYQAIQDASNYSERSMQGRRFEIGLSDLGFCSERTRRMLKQEVPEDTDMLKAWIGTALGDHAEQAAAKAWPWAIVQSTVKATLEGERQTYTISGHPDLILPDEGILIDFKTDYGLTVIRRTGPSRAQQYQRHCLDPDTPVLMHDMKWRRLGDLQVGDKVKAVDDEPLDTGGGRRLRYWRDADVQAVWSTTKPAYEVTLDDGTVLTAGQGHKFLVRKGGNWGWRTVESILRTVENRSGVMYAARPYVGNALGVDSESDDYKAGYLTGANLGDGWYRVGTSTPYQTSYWGFCQAPDDVAVVERVGGYAEHFGVTLTRRLSSPRGGWQKEPILRLNTGVRSQVETLAGLADRVHTDSWKAGWLAGLYDTDGSLSTRRGGVIVYQKDRDVLLQFQQYAKDLGYESKIRVSSRPADCAVIVGPVTTQAQFLALVNPALSRKTERLVGRSVRDFSNTRIVAVREVGQRDLVDITTSAGTFIADGVVSHNCYALGAWEAGYFGDRPLEEVRVANAWIDRAGIDREIHVQMEPYDPQIVVEAAQWLDEVVYAYLHDEEARKEPPIEMCRVVCGFYETCRAYETDAEGLLTDETVVTSVAMYREGLDLEKQGKKLKDEAKQHLDGIKGTTGEFTVRWIHVNETVVPETKRAAYDRLDIRALPKRKTIQAK